MTSKMRYVDPQCVHEFTDKETGRKVCFVSGEVSSMQHTSHLLTPNQAAERIGLSPRFLEARRHRGGGPRFVRVSARCVRYRPEDLERWASERLATSTSDNGKSGGEE